MDHPRWFTGKFFIISFILLVLLSVEAPGSVQIPPVQQQTILVNAEREVKYASFQFLQFAEINPRHFTPGVPGSFSTVTYKPHHLPNSFLFLTRIAYLHLKLPDSAS